MTENNFKTQFNAYQILVEEHIKKSMPSNGIYPEIIHEAMNYSLLAGGKRLRPILCLAAFRLFSENYSDVLPVAVGLECIHTYSLIHDDLPCMDNDDFRRGMPTCHKKYGEAIAVLAGDALLTEAFGLIARFPDEKVIGTVVQDVSSACGSRGLIGGQVMDILSENKRIDEKTLLYIHRHKTGKLITVSVRVGGVCALADETRIKALSDYGDALGLAFQISDDILDVTGSSEKLGKNVGQDEKLRKATYPSIYGLEPSKVKLREAVEQAAESVAIFGTAGWFLRELAEFVGSRDR